MTHLHCDSSSLLPAHYFLPRPPITSGSDRKRYGGVID
uniref:Uncharacterized protein n=1 Tax=Rhizophora mucronata TaxID=61149 RepID=A0A2P2K219_RHIMU